MTRTMYDAFGSRTAKLGGPTHDFDEGGALLQSCSCSATAALAGLASLPQGAECGLA